MEKTGSKYHSIASSIRNTKHLVHSLRNLKVGANCYLVKLDIKGFFVSGRHDDLRNTIANLFTGAYGRMLADVTAFLLAHQFVEEHDTVVQVDVGSGMGCIHNGDVGDLCDYVLVELGFILDPRVRESFGIISYTHFKDDLLLIIDNSLDVVYDCIGDIQQRAQYFTATVDEVSIESVEMLDVTLSKTTSWHNSDVLRVSHFVKPTAVGQFRFSDSCHPRSTHNGWPLARLPHFKLTNTCMSDYKDGCILFHNKLANHDPGHNALQRFRNRVLGLDVCGSKDSDGIPRAYVAVPFSHACRGANFNGVLASVHNKHAELLAIAETSVPMLANVAWSKAATNLLTKVYGTWKCAYNTR